MELLFPLLLTISYFKGVSLKLFNLELEKFSPSAMRMPRSGASGNFTVLFKDRDFVQIEFCLRAASDVNVRNIVYSNDGPTDSIRTSIDDIHMGSFETSYFEGGGGGWNIFRSSGVQGNNLKLEVGRHLLLIEVLNSDRYGVEIDNILISIGDNFLEYDDLLCNSYCFDVKYEDVPRRDSIPSGRFVQKSVYTRCSEQDNVKVEIYHDTITDFEITANIPKYVSFSNNRNPNYHHCILASPYWIFRDLIVNFSSPELRSAGATVRFSGSDYRTMVTVIFNFKDLTPIRELDEKLIGSVLFLKLRNMPRENVKVKPEYLKAGIWRELQEIEFTPFETEHTWELPDGTWNSVEENQLKLTIEPGKQQVVIEALKLNKRDSRDSTIDMYADENVVFQGVRLGFWHHWVDQPKSMSVYIQSAEYIKIDSLRVYAKVPWTGGFSQVFVLFQDGRVRLQAITPHGLDYIPFGPSVNIGQPKFINQVRPYSPIERLDIDPRGLTMAVRYVDGNKAIFILNSTYTQTKLIVKDAFFNKTRNVYPIMTFQSMWIQDGNADTDHVTINGDTSRHITSDWKELFGISAVFFRKCISHHNTQGPDITIKFISSNNSP